jgi:hypothetical protein
MDVDALTDEDERDSIHHSPLSQLLVLSDRELDSAPSVFRDTQAIHMTSPMSTTSSSRLRSLSPDSLAIPRLVSGPYDECPLTSLTK